MRGRVCGTRARSRTVTVRPIGDIGHDWPNVRYLFSNRFGFLVDWSRAGSPGGHRVRLQGESTLLCTCGWFDRASNQRYEIEERAVEYADSPDNFASCGYALPIGKLQWRLAARDDGIVCILQPKDKAPACRSVTIESSETVDILTLPEGVPVELCWPVPRDQLSTRYSHDRSRHEHDGHFHHHRCGATANRPPDRDHSGMFVPCHNVT